MNTRLTPHQKERLPLLESTLQLCVKNADATGADAVTSKILVLLNNDRAHYRLIRAKLWSFEASVDANKLNYAESGLIGIRAMVPNSSRLHLEASALLSVCYLRQKKITDAKVIIKEVVKRYSNIGGVVRRQQFQRRFIERVEQECIISELIGVSGSLDENAVHEQAVKLAKSSTDELYDFLGRSLPPASLSTFSDVRSYSILQLPAPDRLALPSPKEAEHPIKLGKSAYSIIGRVAWKAICNTESTVYKLWSQKMADIYEKSYFAAAIIAALKEWHIGATMFASGIVALAMRSSAADFCDWSKPKGIIIDRKEQP